MTLEAADSPTHTPAAGGNSDSFAARVLAESVSAWERIQPNPINDMKAADAARRADGDFEHRVIVRATSLPVASSLQEALIHVRGALTLVVLAAVVLAIVAGAATARAVLGGGGGGGHAGVGGHDEPVNFFWAIGSILGLQTLILFIWIGLMLGGKRLGSQALAAVSLGALVVRFAQFVTAKLHKGPEHAAAVAAFGSVYLRGPLGKWTVGSLSNWLWLSFNVGCMVVLIALLSTREYLFRWETTILSEAQYKPLTHAIAALPKLAGFPTPTSEQIHGSQWRRGENQAGKLHALHEHSQAWSGLLVGSVVLYGFGPRLLLLAFCLGQRRQAKKMYRLETNRPEFLHLQSRLMPQSQSLGVVDEDDGAASGIDSMNSERFAHADRPLGPPAIFGFEVSLSAGSTSWPPQLHAVRWVDLGFVDGRDDQRRVLRQLGDAATEPATVVVVCGLTTTPDRGVGHFLNELQSTVSRPLTLVLTGGHTLRQRTDTDQLSRRLDDWRMLATAAGIQPQRVIEIDLEHMTQASSANLAALLNPDTNGTSRVNRRLIEQSFDLIAEYVDRWFARGIQPTTIEQAELHRQIARLYRDDQIAWRDLIMAPKSLGTNLVGQLKSSSDRMIELLPDRLRRSPKWLAAGAAAGALGCVAAASFIAPVAIASLPMWAGIGAALAAVLQTSRTKTETADASMSGIEFDDALRSAALFAILLELQGRGEKAITRILDRVLQVDDNHVAASFQAARLWLDQLRHRLDIALTSEAIQ